MNRRPVMIKGTYYPSVSFARKKLNIPRINLVYAIEGPNEEMRYATPEEIQLHEPTLVKVVDER
jgi:hypothetical protein